MPGNPDTLTHALAPIAKKFRTKIIKSYIDLKAAFVSAQYDSAGLRAGVFAEAVVRLLQEELTGSHTPFGTRLPNFADLCRGFEKLSQAQGSESFRVLIPRALLFIYTLRNKRGVGHIGGEVEANQIDAAAALKTADWCISELIRLYSKLPLEEGQRLLDSIAVRELPELWQVGGKTRVLTPGLKYTDQTLLMIYGSPEEAVIVEDLFDWIEHPRLSDYKKILRRLHKERFIEFDEETNTCSFVTERGNPCRKYIVTDRRITNGSS